jgi:hypothetical protein
LQEKMSSEAIREHKARREELARRIDAMAHAERDKATAAGFAPADKLVIEWSVEQTKWIDFIGRTLLAHIHSTCDTLAQISEAHDRLENMCEEWAAKQLMVREQERQRQREEDNAADPEHQHLHRDDFVDGGGADIEIAAIGMRENRKVIRHGFMDEVGPKWFQDCNMLAMTSGYVMQYVKVEILPDFMLPEAATTATIEQYILEQFTNFACPSVLTDGIRFEVALPLGMYSQLSTGGYRFLNEVIRGVTALVHEMFVSVPFGESVQFGQTKQPMLPTETPLKGLSTFSHIFAVGIRFPRKKYKHDAALYARANDHAYYRMAEDDMPAYNMPRGYVQAQARF